MTSAENNINNEDNIMGIVAPQTIAGALNLRGAKVVQRSKKMGGGFEGRVKILRTELGSTRNGPAFFVKYEVVETNDPDNVPVGSERTWKQSIQTSKGTEVAMNNILLFTAVCAGMDPDDPAAIEAADEELNGIVNAAINDPENAQGQNPFINVMVGLVTEAIITDGGQGRPFVVHMWSP